MMSRMVQSDLVPSFTRRDRKLARHGDERATSMKTGTIISLFP